MSDHKEHYTDEAWFEFANGRVPSSGAKEMQAHLASGCAECGQACRTWSLIVAAAARQRDYEPPQEVVRSVKFAFTGSHHLHAWSQMATLARLVFDSFREPVPIGVRGTTSAPRHLLHDSGRFVIDLRLEKELSGRVLLVGQILPKDTAGYDTGGANVVVAAKQERLLAQAIANSVGEFQLEFAETRELMVYIAIPNESVIAITLPEPDATSASGSSF